MELTVCDLCALIPGQMGKVAVHEEEDKGVCLLNVYSRLTCTPFHNVVRACKVEEGTPVSQASCLKVQLSSWNPVA